MFSTLKEEAEINQDRFFDCLRSILETLRSIQSRQDWFFDQASYPTTINDIREVHRLTRAFYDKEKK